MQIAATAIAFVTFLTAAEGKAGVLPDLVSLQQVNLEELEPAVRDQISRAYEEARRRPQDAKAVGKLGMIFQVYGKYDLAENCFLRARGLDPGAFRWTYYLGNVEGLLGKNQQAIGHVQDALKLDANYAQARVRLGQLLFEAGDAGGAAKAYREALEQNPRLATAHFGLGRILAAEENWPSAIETYRRACALAKNYSAAHYALAMAYRRTGDVASARAQLELYQRAKQAKQPLEDPAMEDVNALYSGGLTRLANGSSLAQQGKLREAAAEFEEALKVNPQLMAAHINLIAMYGQLGLAERAESHFRAAVELNPGWVEIYYNWGLYQLQRGSKSEAALMFHKAIEINPNYSDAQVQLGQLLDESGRLAEAAVHFDRALEIKPDHRQAHYLLGRNLVRRGLIDQGIRHFLETVRVEDNRTPVCMHALAVAYERAGNREKALYYFQEARKRAAAFAMGELVSQLDGELNRVKAEGSHR